MDSFLERYQYYWKNNFANSWFKDSITFASNYPLKNVGKWILGSGEAIEWNQLGLTFFINSMAQITFKISLLHYTLREIPKFIADFELTQIFY